MAGQRRRTAGGPSTAGACAALEWGGCCCDGVVCLGHLVGEGDMLIRGRCQLRQSRSFCFALQADQSRIIEQPRNDVLLFMVCYFFLKLVAADFANRCIHKPKYRVEVNNDLDLGLGIAPTHQSGYTHTSLIDKTQ